MADFTKYSNYNERESFSGVTFGANAPVLEVELNEVQQIADTKIKRLMSAIGSSVIPMSNGSISFKDSTLTISNCVVTYAGFSAFIQSAKVSISGSNKYAYIKLEEKTVSGGNTLKEYGNTAGSTTPNTIIDSRSGGVETSKRRVIEVTLLAGASVPNDTDSIKYVAVGEISNDEFVFTTVKDSAEDLGFSIVDGALCVTYDDEE